MDSDRSTEHIILPRSSFNTSNASNPDMKHDIVKYCASNDKVTMSGTAILDKGSNMCIMAKANFTPSQLRKYVTPKVGQCMGINGPCRIVGQFKCEKLTIGDKYKRILSNVFFDVLDTTCPTLIGQSILGRGQNRRLTYDYDRMMIDFEYKNGELGKIDLTDKMDGVPEFEVLTTSEIIEARTDKDMVQWAESELRG